MDGLKKGTQEYINKKSELKGLTDQMADLKKTIGITSLSQKELVSELNKLKSLRGSVIPFSDEYKQLSKSIKEVDNRLYDVRNGVQGFASAFSKVKDEVKQFGVAAAAYLGFQFITSQFQNIIRGAGKLSDQLADLQRASGLTREEVDELNSSFKKLDTRTSTETLRDIATIAARLGVGKDDIAGFTREFDKLVVALGNSLGDADAAATTLGKILNVFDGKITGENISKLGNAIVSLDQSGVASGAFLADFAQRLSDVSKNANLSLGSLLGLGAGIEEMGGRVESGSTAIQKIIQSIATDIPKAAKIAGVEIKEFAELFAKAPEEAIVRFAEGLVKNKASFTEITASFKDAGEEGARVVSTLSSIGNSGDLMRKRIAEGQKTIQETAAINEGFALKNETLGATLDKLGKDFNRLVTSNAVTNFLKGAVEGASSFLRALQELPNWIDRNTTALQLILIGVVLLRKAYILSALDIINETAVKIYNAAATKAIAIANNIAIASQAAYITITNLLTGRIVLATAAQRLWNIATAAGAFPLGAIVIAAGVLIIALNTLIGKNKELTAIQKVNAEVQQKVAEATTAEVARIELLKKVIESSNSSYENRKKALDALIAINPSYLQGLTLENIKTLEGKNILDGYIASLKTKAELEAKNAVYTEKLTAKQKAFATLRAEPEFSAYTDDQLEKFFRDADKQSKGNKIFGLGPDQKFLGINIPELTKTFDQIKVLSDDLAKAATKNVEDVIGKTGNVITSTSGKTVASLKAQIKGLDESFENIEVRNTKALSQNRDQRKKLQAELDALDGKSGAQNEKSFNRAAKQIDHLKEAWKKLNDEINDSFALMKDDPFAQGISKANNEAEESQKKLKLFFDKRVIDQQQYAEASVRIEAIRHKKIEDLVAKFVKPVSNRDPLALSNTSQRITGGPQDEERLHGLMNQLFINNMLVKMELKLLPGKDYDK